MHVVQTVCTVVCIPLRLCFTDIRLFFWKGEVGGGGGDGGGDGGHQHLHSSSCSYLGIVASIHEMSITGTCKRGQPSSTAVHGASAGLLEQRQC